MRKLLAGGTLLGLALAFGLLCDRGTLARAEPLSADKPAVLTLLGPGNASPSLSGAHLMVKWQRSLPVSRLPVAVSSVAVAVSAQGQLFTLDLQTGNDLVHPIRLGTPNAGAPSALTNGTFVVASPSEELLLVRDGEVTFRIPLPGLGPIDTIRAKPLADGGFVYGARSRVFIADANGFVRRSASLPSLFATAKVVKSDIVFETLDHSTFVWRGRGGFASAPEALEDARDCVWSGARCVQSERILRLGAASLDLAFRAPPSTVFASGLSRTGGVVLLATSSRLFLLELGDDDKELRRIPVRPLSGADGGAVDLPDALRTMRPVVDSGGSTLFAWEGQAIRVSPSGDTQTLDLCERNDALVDFAPSREGVVYLCTRGRVGLLYSE